MRKWMHALAAIMFLVFAIDSTKKAFSQECVTMGSVVARTPGHVFITLHGVDIGDEDRAEVVIFEAQGQYLAVAFEGGCYAGYQEMDESGVEKFINENTKKADGA